MFLNDKKIKRPFQTQIEQRLRHNPVVALLGARLAKFILEKYPHSIYLDLEKSSDRRKIESDLELFLDQNQGH